PFDTRSNTNLVDFRSPSPRIASAFEESLHYTFSTYSEICHLTKDFYFTYILPFIRDHVDSIVSKDSAVLQTQLNTVTAEKERYNQASRRRIRLSGRHFYFLPISQWSLRFWSRNALRELSPEQGRNMAAQFMVAADGDFCHPTILANPAYRLRK
ncbi:hypothetical protein A4X13_0g9032, partial [Tilletia indica]